MISDECEIDVSFVLQSEGGCQSKIARRRLLFQLAADWPGFDSLSPFPTSCLQTCDTDHWPTSRFTAILPVRFVVSDAGVEPPHGDRSRLWHDGPRDVPDSSREGRKNLLFLSRGLPAKIPRPRRCGGIFMLRVGAGRIVAGCDPQASTEGAILLSDVSGRRKRFAGHLSQVWHGP